MKPTGLPKGMGESPYDINHTERSISNRENMGAGEVVFSREESINLLPMHVIFRNIYIKRYGYI